MVAVTLRFRPVLMGDPAHTATVWYLLEEPSGRVRFWQPELSWPLAVALDDVTRDDLPAYYQRPDVAITILPVQHVTGEALADAHARVSAAVEALAAERATARRSSPLSA
jgi:hypothetical protein